ncbi:XRE family transcriptional regulator [Lichenibacterium ramalinae]|jgi:ribosome-binding protein aMBF1 (putative translation factor)|uniref:XRE family transcriptional regulator n=1 Tax=Lichenibacterium ramalinae TaxID=2316527 RepID=A0A4Q2R799_9HYPH|nr:XRE family transcriptional regulator [Lichenibacterium ramalinae]RYB01354.1 XRE family transcriptional regulator [Lichenibacterium ramalinae]
MITGRQIREARALLGLQRSQLAARVRNITTATIMRAELVDGEPPITTAQADALKEALERAGIEFTSDPPSARLRAAEP